MRLAYDGVLNQLVSTSETTRALSFALDNATDSTRLAAANSLANSGMFREAHDAVRPLATLGWNIPIERLNEIAHGWALSLYGLRKLDELQDFLRSHGPRLDAEVAARSQIKLAWLHLMLGDERSSVETMAAAEVRAEKLRSQVVLAETMYFEGYRKLSRRGQLGSAAESLSLACSLFRLHGERLLLSHCLLARAEIHWGLGHPGFAEASLLEALQIAADIGNRRAASSALYLLGVYSYQQGRYEDSAKFISESTIAIESDDDATQRTLRRTRLAEARLGLFMNQPETTLEILSSTADSTAHADVIAEALHHEFRALAYTQLLDYETALHEFAIARDCLTKSGTRTYELAGLDWQEAEIHLAMHNPRIALELANRAVAIIEECGNYREFGQILRIKATSLAMLARDDEALPLFHQAIDELRRRNNQYELALTLTRLAETLESDPAAAAEVAGEAVSIFQRLELPERANEAHHALDVARLRVHASLRAQETERPLLEEDKIVAEAPSMGELLADCQLVAQSRAAVIITGETGVGKEVVANFIHDHSPQSQGPFVPINCAALPESLFEREFFGHKKGAFTGADRDTPGLVTAASGGTLFLDEIGELPLPMQAKLLRLLQEHTYRRVGDVNELHADIRILAATNRNLKEQVAEKTFREDLWYRLNAFEVRVPPLRERTEDIAPLTDLFLEKESEGMGIEFWMDREVRQLFLRYPWPGNVRELQAAITAGTARAIEDGCVRVQHLPHDLRRSKGMKPPALLSLSKHLEVEERRLILHALRRSDSSRAEAARYLGIGRNTLYEKMQRLGITVGKSAKG